jgi:hypothetical protein
VEKVLGKPSTISHNWAVYQTPKEAISILYSNGLDCLKGANSQWKVPRGTVISITVAPKEIILFSTLKVDMSVYQVLADTHKLNHREYFSEKVGESISVVDDEVSSFRYSGGIDERNLLCPAGSARENRNRGHL